MSGSYGQMLIPQKPRGNVPEYKRQGGVYVPGSAGVPAVSDAPGQVMANAAKAASSMEAATGESIGKLAGATANAVKVGVKAYEDYQAAKAQQAFNSYQAEEMKLRAELGTLQGENALGEHGVMARLEQWRNEARGRLVENLAPIARDLFDRHSRLLDARTDAWAIQKQYRENIAFQNSASEGSIANAFALALEQPLDDAAQGSALGIVKAELERMGQRSGWDSSLVQSKLRTAAQKLEGDRIEALIAAGNLDAAQSVLDKAGQTGGKADIRGMPSEVEKLVRQAAKKYGVREDLALAMVMQESGGNQNAVSKAGAIGPTQLMPPTARDLGVNPYDLAENIDGGVSYLAQQLQKFGNETDALTAYNWGPGNMQKHIKGGRSGPMPKEAREYAMRVYGRMANGMAAEQKRHFQNKIDRGRKLALEEQNILLAGQIIENVSSLPVNEQQSAAYGLIEKIEPQKRGRIVSLVNDALKFNRDKRDAEEGAIMAQYLEIMPKLSPLQREEAIDGLLRQNRLSLENAGKLRSFTRQEAERVTPEKENTFNQVLAKINDRIALGADNALTDTAMIDREFARGNLTPQMRRELVEIQKHGGALKNFNKLQADALYAKFSGKKNAEMPSGMYARLFRKIVDAGKPLDDDAIKTLVARELVPVTTRNSSWSAFGMPLWSNKTTLWEAESKGLEVTAMEIPEHLADFVTARMLEEGYSKAQIENKETRQKFYASIFYGSK